MDKAAFWQQKLVQFFHDPPAKPYSGFGNSVWFKSLVDGILAEEHTLTGTAKNLTEKTSYKGHRAIAAALFQAYTGKPLEFVRGTADWCTASADRPMLYARSQSQGVRVYWPKEPLITHPLAPRFRLDVRPPADEGEPKTEEKARRETAHELLQAQLDTVAGASLAKPDWGDADGLQTGFTILWRRFRDELVGRRAVVSGMPGSDPLWEEMPADSRCPDHSVWDHLRVTSALAFLKPHRMNERQWLDNQWQEGAREPWMLRFSIGPVQSFIAEARTGRDLWTGSMLLAELTWASMAPFIQQYGPDCILYPDLRANPRVDNWLYDAYPDALRPVPDPNADDPSTAKRIKPNPSSFAALLPATFVVLIPRGGQGHLETVEAVAAAAQQRVTERWGEFAAKVKDWFVGHVGKGGWTDIWDRQIEEPPFYCIWTAVPWLPLGCIRDPNNLVGPALPAQNEESRSPEVPEAAAHDQAVMAARAGRLRPWVPPEVWSQYERARDTYARSHLEYHQMERGFDYALTHHQLSTRHTLRKQNYPLRKNQLAHEHGEKCTLCGTRQALTNADEGAGGLDHLRARARTFWSQEILDPDRTGGERLCAVCALKRFLVTADQVDREQSDPELVFNRVWIGPDPNAIDDLRDRDGKLRVPFPSSATVAAQAFVDAILKDASLRQHVTKLLDACRRARLERTSFPRSLPRLTALAETLDEGIRAILEYEAEDVLFPDALEGKARGLEERAKRQDPTEMRPRAAGLKAVAAASRSLLKAARERDKTLGGPGTRIAVIRMDGDRMGQLLLGDSASIATRWRDIIHPAGVDQIQRSQNLLEAGWGDLLDAKRLMGPSLHAFVSRALGHFAHRIAPWVVEMEFAGRLIYAGGDDLLCIAPADDALDLAARLQQLFSAAWVVDTEPQADPWCWRRQGWKGGYDQSRARQRFAIPIMGSENEAIRLPVDTAGRLARHSAYDQVDWRPRVPVAGPLLPMLGTGASLSAGIAFGHFKTPLSTLLDRAKALLDLAKDPNSDLSPSDSEQWSGRRALAVGHASRGGTKTTFVLPWTDTEETMHAHQLLRAVIKGFQVGSLPSRLPYKLRERALAVQQARRVIADICIAEGCAHDREQHLLEGLLRDSLDGSNASDEMRAGALALWHQGIRLHPNNPERYTDGLLFCRALAHGEDDDSGDAS